MKIKNDYESAVRFSRNNWVEDAKITDHSQKVLFFCQKLSIFIVRWYMHHTLRKLLLSDNTIALRKLLLNHLDILSSAYSGFEVACGDSQLLP